MGSTLLRALIAVVAGVLMVEYREDMVKWLTILVGVLFFLSGFISVVYYYVTRRKYDRELAAAQGAEDGTGTVGDGKPAPPVVGVGCAILGIILALIPETVAEYLVYVFAVIIILGAVGEFVALVSAHMAMREFRKTYNVASASRCGYVFYVLPALLLVFAVVAIIHPAAICSAPFLFLGIAFIIYGLSEVLGLIKTSSSRKHISRATASFEAAAAGTETITDAEIVSEDESGRD